MTSGWPPHGWDRYGAQCEDLATVARLQAVSEFLARRQVGADQADVWQTAWFSVDYRHLAEDSQLQQQWPAVDQTVLQRPDAFTALLCLAMHHRLVTASSTPASTSTPTSSSSSRLPSKVRQTERLSDGGDSDTAPPPPPLSVRWYGVRPLTSLHELNSASYGRLVSVRGTVVRMSAVQPHCLAISYRCSACGGVFRHQLTAGVLQPPRSCACCGRQQQRQRQLVLRPLHSYRHTETVDRQTLWLQQLAEDGTEQLGRVPRAVECELLGAGLVDGCVPGDVVCVCGVVRTQPQLSAQSPLQQLFISASSVHSVRSAAAKGASGVTFSRKDYYTIRELHERPDVFRVLVDALCPAIYGHHMVKAGLLLALFGGSEELRGSEGGGAGGGGDGAGGGCGRRASCHVLLLGDPGLGKSQLLHACVAVAPRGVYVCGASSSGVGLTVAVSSGGGGGAGGGHRSTQLEAGALVLADRGCCCIDEFDKLGAAHTAPLLEAMEQQCVSVARAGLVCSLAARASVLAAANPSGGHYDTTRSLLDNVRLGAPLLSRFDLLYVLVDRPDCRRDSRVSSHIMAQQACSSTSVSATRSHNTSCDGGSVFSCSSSSTAAMASSCSSWDTRAPLAERLQSPLDDGQQQQPSPLLLPPSLLRKYIAYARRYVQPRLSGAACQVLQRFFLQLRAASRLSWSNQLPVTVRQLESLVRLTEARARLQLCTVATAQHAADVVELMQFAVETTGGATSDPALFTQLHSLSATRAGQRRAGKGKGSRLKRFVAALYRCSEQMGRSEFSEQELKQMMAPTTAADEFQQLLETANHQGLLINKGSGVYHLSS